MTRRAVGLDRAVSLLAGLWLLALGVTVLAWRYRVVGGGRPLRLMGIDLFSAAWWPWASGAAGVVVFLIGLRWLLAHRRAPRASRVGLDRSDAELTADAGSAAAAAADVLESQPAVIKATGAAAIERGIPTLTLTVRVPARHGLRDAVRACDDTAFTVAQMLGHAVAVRSVVHVDDKKHDATVQ